MPAKFQTHEFLLPPEVAGWRLDQALAAALPQYSRSRLQQWLAKGAVTVAGVQPRASLRIAGGEAVSVRAEFELDESVLPQALDLDIVHEDAALLVINKPAGLVVHPGAGNRSHTLQNALLAHDPNLACVPRAGLVHRLDKDTSGLLVVARTPEAHRQLVRALAEREFERRYAALVLGCPTAGASIDEPIARHRSLRTRMAVRADGRPAVTHYRIAERFRGHTLLAVQLETGRTHQIRVHMAHIGFPVVGDPVYGGRRRLVAGASAPLLAELKAFHRQALHAQRLGLAHPVTGDWLAWEAPIPPDFAALLTALRVDAGPLGAKGHLGDWADDFDGDEA
jgi:23S rRNA pseudouridine1911/1915/1917 synthase